MSVMELPPRELNILRRIIAGGNEGDIEKSLATLNAFFNTHGINIHQDMRVIAFVGPHTYIDRKLNELTEQVADLEKQLLDAKNIIVTQAATLKSLHGISDKSEFNQRIADTRMSRNEICDKMPIVFELYKEGLAANQIGEETGINEITVRSRLLYQRPPSNIICEITSGIPTFEEAWEIGTCLFVDNAHPSYGKRQGNWLNPLFEFVGVNLGAKRGWMKYSEYCERAKTIDLVKFDILREEYRQKYPLGQSSKPKPKTPKYASNDSLISILKERGQLSREEIVKILDSKNLPKNTKRLHDLVVVGKVIEVDHDIYCLA